MTTTNFSDVLAPFKHLQDTAMHRKEIASAALSQEVADGDRLDELEQLALEALDDIWLRLLKLYIYIYK